MGMDEKFNRERKYQNKGRIKNMDINRMGLIDSRAVK
jgi:hypothetical protein